MVGRVVLRRTVPVQIMRMTMRQIGGDGIERLGMGARTMRGGDDERSDQQGGNNHQGPDGPDNSRPPMISRRLHPLLAPLLFTFSRQKSGHNCATRSGASGRREHLGSIALPIRG